MSQLVNHEDTRVFVESWVEALVRVLESMTNRTPEVRWRAVTTPPELPDGLGAETICWEQALEAPEQAELWVVAPRQTWKAIGVFTLEAAGLDASHAEEVKSTWLEIVAEWLSGFARALGSYLGVEVALGAGLERNPPAADGVWMSLSLRFGETDLPPITVAFSPALITLLASAPAGTGSPLRAAETPDDAAPQTAAEITTSPTLDLLMDVELPVSISFGKTHLQLKDALKLTTGSIVELNRAINEPVEILVNQFLIARGEVVVVDGNYGVRIQQIVSRQDRLRTVG